MKKTVSFMLILAMCLSLVPFVVQAYAPDASAVTLLNSAPLRPQKTGNTELDNKVEGLLNGFRQTNTDTYGLVKASYDYLVQNVEYPTKSQYKYVAVPKNLETNGTFPPYIIVDAKQALFDGLGVCNDYAAAFVVMARAIGLEAFHFTGQTRAAAGGYIGHTWAVVCINDVFYIFDPQVEDNVAKGGAIRYMYFCKAEADMTDRFKGDAAANKKIVELYRSLAPNIEPVAEPLPVVIPTPEPTPPPILVLYNAERIEFDQDPILENNRVLVPIGALLAKFGVETQWFPETQEIHAVYNELPITLRIDDTQATIGEEVITLDVAPRLVNNRTLVPLRFIAEALDKDVHWFGDTRTIMIADRP